MSEDNRMNAPVDEEMLRDRSLLYSLRDGLAWSVMVGFGDHYLGPFALFWGATTMQMGILASLPPFLGAVFQIFSARATDALRARRRIIVPAAGFQGLLWILIFWIPTLVPTSAASSFLIVFVALFSIAGHFTVPPWHSLMGDLVPPDRRGVYFARRNRLCQIFTIVSVGLAGLVLHYFKSAGAAWHVYGFLIIFGVACVARLISTAYLSMQYEPVYTPPPKEEQMGFLEFLRTARRLNFGRFTLFSSIMNFSIHLSAPFFVVYMMRDLGFTYLQFTTVVSMVVLSHILTLVFWGKVADRFGNRWVILSCSLGLGLCPFFLPLSTHFYYIAFFQFVVATVGAGFNLASANYVFDAVSPPQRARCVAYYHVINATGLLLGGLSGGWLATRMPSELGIGAIRWNLPSNLLTLFLLSGVLRLATLASFRSAFQELRPVEPAPHGRLLFRIAFLERDHSRWMFPHK